MTIPDARAILSVWERGASQTAAVRALLMLRVVLPDAAPESLAELSVGHRDAQLLSLREQMFGPTLDCLTRCPQCTEAIELDFDVDDVRVTHADPGASFRIEVDGYDLHFRVPNSTDLLALLGERDPAMARRRLLSRCVLKAHSSHGALAPDELPEGPAQVVGDRMGDLDPQAEVILDVRCPNCGHLTHAPFEIENYLWAEIDSRAKELLQDIHLIASVYGWSEADILSMSTARRRAYLDLLRS